MIRRDPAAAVAVVPNTLTTTLDRVLALLGTALILATGTLLVASSGSG